MQTPPTIPRLRFPIRDKQRNRLLSLSQFDPDAPCDVASSDGRTKYRACIRQEREFARPMQFWTPPAWSPAVRRHPDVAPAARPAPFKAAC